MMNTSSLSKPENTASVNLLVLETISVSQKKILEEEEITTSTRIQELDEEDWKKLSDKLNTNTSSILRRFRPAKTNLTDGASSSNEEIIKKFKETIIKWRKGLWNESVINAAVMNFFESLERAFILGEEAMLDLYEKIYYLPESSTKQRIVEKAEVSIYESISPNKVNVFSGTNMENGSPLIIKFITPKEEELMNLLNSYSIHGLITSKVVKIPSTKFEGERIMLVMPRLITDVAHQPSANPSVIFQQAKRIQSALDDMHKCGLVHLDVKLENILVDSTGSWHLSDFDFTCKVNDYIPSMYNSYFPRNIRGHIALPSIDLYLLGVHLVVELCCKDNLTLIQGKIGVDKEKVIKILSEYENKDPSTEDLKAFIFELLNNFYENCGASCVKCVQFQEANIIS